MTDSALKDDRLDFQQQTISKQSFDEVGTKYRDESDDKHLRSESRLNMNIRPSKNLRLNDIVSKPSKICLLNQRRETRKTPNTTKRKLNEEKKTLGIHKLQGKNMKLCKNNVIFDRTSSLQPVPLPAPESVLTQTSVACNLQSSCIDDATHENPMGNPSNVSPHLARVLKKQYTQHLQWMASHGTSEASLRRLEKDYEDLLERYATRSKQIRKEICEQARVAALKTQKGMNTCKPLSHIFVPYVLEYTSDEIVTIDFSLRLLY